MEDKTIACISCCYKGYDFIDELKKLGNKVILITSEKLREKNWPWHAIDEVFYMSEISPSVWNMEHFIQGFSHLMQTRKVDTVVALDDYDVEKAALIRETFRISGMGQTTHRFFRDKLAMRQQAKETGIPVPEFTAVFNNQEVENFISKVPAPWVLKPRSEASSSGIKKIENSTILWEEIENLGKERHLFLLESFKPGNVYHVDSLVYHHDIVFSCCSKYASPPMKVSHEGGVFQTKTLGRNSSECAELLKINETLLHNFKLKHGAAHSEFIRGEDGQYYFLETSSRVGGAHIPDMVEAATGINIWKEWAKMETAILRNETYHLPPVQENFGGLLVALVHSEPETNVFQRKELVKFLPVKDHIGIVYQSLEEQKIQECLDDASRYISENLLSIIPPTSKPKI